MTRARYFCEHCGAEVLRDAKYCGKCGRFFSAVRCPRCQFSGSPSAFRDGCPVCGFSAASPEEYLPDLDATASRPKHPAEALSPWVYVAAVSALLAAAAVFLLVATR